MHASLRDRVLLRQVGAVLRAVGARFVPFVQENAAISSESGPHVEGQSRYLVVIAGVTGRERRAVNDADGRDPQIPCPDANLALLERFDQLVGRVSVGQCAERRRRPQLWSKRSYACGRETFPFPASACRIVANRPRITSSTTTSGTTWRVGSISAARAYNRRAVAHECRKGCPCRRPSFGKLRGLLGVALAVDLAARCRRALRIVFERVVRRSPSRGAVRHVEQYQFAVREPLVNVRATKRAVTAATSCTFVAPSAVIAGEPRTDAWNRPVTCCCTQNRKRHDRALLPPS